LIASLKAHKKPGGEAGAIMSISVSRGAHQTTLDSSEPIQSILQGYHVFDDTVDVPHDGNIARS
jgi:hypothetical protein